jgi:hypothetical protein
VDARKKLRTIGGELKMEEKMQRNKVFDTVAWGAFIITLAAGWLVSEAYKFDTIAYIALGAGIILVALNIARYSSSINISRFSLFVGIMALALSGTGIAGYALPFFPTLILIIGLFIVARAAEKMLGKKQIQP